MALHLIKLSVGSDTIQDLARWQQTLLKRHRGTSLEGYASHVTRMFPRRADELVAGGSIYWVIARQVQCRQRIVRVEETQTSQGRKCRLVLDADLIATSPAARRPFQGWRYLTEDDAPRDLSSGAGGDEDLPIRQELAELGLL